MEKVFFTTIRTWRRFGALGLLLSLSSCLVSAPAAPAPASTSPVTIATPTSPLSCSTKVIDAGQKGTVAGTIRGAYADTKMIPGTSSPATAFVDQSNLSIKLTYWSGAEPVTEIVSGDGTGAFVRLAFTSSGIPFVFWTLGTSVKVAIRSEPISTAGASWTAGVIDTGVAPRALEVSVNPLNQVMVSFVTDTAVTGREKFVYCDTNCTSPSQFQTMTSNPFVDNTNIIQGMVGTGAAWCQSNSTTYYPMVSYNVTGNTKVAVCQNSLANCLNGANWTTGVVVAAGNTISKLLLDPTVAGDIPKVATYNAANLITYSMGATACTSAPAAFTASANLGNFGSQWISFLKDPTNGKFHLLANSAATSVVYLNSQTTNPIGVWNANGTVETIGLPAATGGGAAIDGATNGIYVSYGVNAADFDLKVSRVGDYTQASNSATETFSHDIPDLSGMVQFSPTAGAQLKNVAVASNPSGVPGVAYVDFSAGAVTTGKLKFALRTGKSSSDGWNPYIIPDTVSPQFPGLAFDQNSRPWVSFYDAGTNKFMLATNSFDDGSGSWNLFEFPVLAGSPVAALPAANNTAVAMYYSGGIANPVLIAIDTSAASRGVKAATLNSTTRVWGPVTTIDALGANGAAHLSADFDINGDVVVAFQDLTATQVKYAYQTGLNAWSGDLAVSAVARGPGTSIRINPVTTKPVITYFDEINNVVYYSPCSGTIASCISGGWTSTAVEALAGVSGLTAATGQLLTTSLVFNSSGFAQILYPRGAGNDGNLIMNENFNRAFANQVASSGINGALVGSPALNFGIAGWGISAAANAGGGVTGAFVGPGNWLYAVSCGD